MSSFPAIPTLIQFRLPVVSSSPRYYDTIDSIYEDKELMPHFLRGHYTLEWFKNDYGNPKLKAIYERAMSCQYCINNERVGSKLRNWST